MSSLRPKEARGSKKVEKRIWVGKKPLVLVLTAKLIKIGEIQ